MRKYTNQPLPGMVLIHRLLACSSAGGSGPKNSSVSVSVEAWANSNMDLNAALFWSVSISLRVSAS